MIFTASNKNSYLCSDRPILVTKLDGRPVYEHPNPTGEAIVFNLPSGMTVKTSNKLKIVKRKIYNLPTFKEFFKRYPRQNHYPTKKGYKIIRTDNPNKASIAPQINKMYMDEQTAKTVSHPTLVFIFIHEYGHYWYEDEDIVDLFAALVMLKMGYNMYDCLNAQIKILKSSEEKCRRILRLLTNFNEYE